MSYIIVEVEADGPIPAEFSTEGEHYRVYHSPLPAVDAGKPWTSTPPKNFVQASSKPRIVPVAEANLSASMPRRCNIDV